MNKYQNAIDLITNDMENRARDLLNSLLQLDRTPEREASEKKLMEQLHEDRRAAVALIHNGKPINQNIG